MKKRITLIASVLVLVLVCATVFAACSPAADPEKAKEKMEKNGYTVVLDSNLAPAGLAFIGITGVKTVLEASNSDGEYLCVVYFSSSADLKEALEKLEKYADDEEKDNKKKDDDSDWVFGKSGKRVWFGTKAAVKAAS